MPTPHPSWRTPLDRPACDAALQAVDGRLRLADAGDTRAMTALLQELAAAEWDHAPVGLGAPLATLLADPEPGFVLVALERGHVAAFAIVQRMAAPTEGAAQLCLDDLYVAHSARRRGLGAALMAGTRAVGQMLGAVYLYLHVRPENVAARALYAAEGMEPADVVVYEAYLNR
jgi:ribosomal protein S18 acetylase RimI-like enzyme